MEDINMEDSRKISFNLEEYLNNVQKRNICYNLKNAGKNKTKNVKNLYQIYNLLHHSLKVVIRDRKFDYRKSINDFYEYLGFNINLIKEEIYKYIMLIEDDEFANIEIVKNKIKYYSEHKNIYEKLYNK